MRELQATLERIDGRGYKAYKDLQGRSYSFPDFSLRIDHVQGDPYAAPSRMRVRVPWEAADLPESCLASPPRRRATRDFLARAFATAARSERDLVIDAGAQTVLDRSACLLTDDGIELRFTADLPAAGRRVLGRTARALLCDRLPQVVARAGLAPNLDLDALESHCVIVEDQVALRSALSEAGLVAFVGNGSVLPRRSGVDDRALEEGVAFNSPEALEVTLSAPNAGQVTGMGVTRGVTLIVGGGFHGKSTLLRALESGIWDHVPGDGRELVVSDPGAVKVRAEDGRSISCVDISVFIDRLPQGKPTDAFSTDLASGSTSQAAAVMESLEAGARLLLVDEDTSATNFMIRDQRMQALVASDQEPITPFVDRIRELSEALGVSTVLVMGGSGDYFDHADTVIQMDAYRPLDVTAEARAVAQAHKTGRRAESAGSIQVPRSRHLDTGSVKPETKPGRRKIQARGRDTLVLGRNELDLRAVEQLADASQVRAIGWLLARLCESDTDPVDPIPELEAMLIRLADGDWDWLSGRPHGDLALPRLDEAMAALNRLRGVHLS